MATQTEKAIQDLTLEVNILKERVETMRRGTDALPEITARANEFKPEVARLQTAFFPDNPIALEGLDTIYLNAEKALDLKVPQVTALLAWLHGGGHLIVGVEQVIHVNGNEWLRQLLPCELTGMASVQNHAEIQEWLRSSRRSALD